MRRLLHVLAGPVANLPAVGTGLRRFWDKPYMAIALIVLFLAILECIYAFAPRYSKRHYTLRVVFWILYPLLALTFFSGRKMRKTEDTHQIYAVVILVFGLLLFVSALFF